VRSRHIVLPSGRLYDVAVDPAKEVAEAAAWEMDSGEPGGTGGSSNSDDDVWEGADDVAPALPGIGGAFARTASDISEIGSFCRLCSLNSVQESTPPASVNGDSDAPSPCEDGEGPPAVSQV
jgi:hypothetical protein